MFTGRTDSEAEAPLLCVPDGMSWLIGKDPDEGKIKDRRRRGWQGTRWLDDITQWTWVWPNSGTLEDREAWHVSVHGVTQNQTWLSDSNLRRDTHWQSLLTHNLHGKHFLLLSAPLLWLRCNYHNSWKTNTRDIPSSLSVPLHWRSPFHEQHSHTHLYLHHPQNSLHVGDRTPW